MKRNRLLFFALISGIILASCQNTDDENHPPILELGLDMIYTPDSAVLDINDSIVIGIHAEGVSSNLTYLKIEVVTTEGTTLIYDEGLNTRVLDVNKVFYKGLADEEKFVITVMDYNRQTATATITFFKNAGSAFGSIRYFPSVVLGYQSNTTFGHFLDPDSGVVYDEATSLGHEDLVDIIVYYYLSSGSPSPTLVCPAQSDAQITYPAVAAWPVKNATLYDYHTSDYGLISEAQFDACNNDSLILLAYNPAYVNQKCKFATAGKIIPFLTASGKKGLIKVISADLSDTGTMTIDIKIQQ